MECHWRPGVGLTLDAHCLGAQGVSEVYIKAAANPEWLVGVDGVPVCMLKSSLAS